MASVGLCPFAKGYTLPEHAVCVHTGDLCLPLELVCPLSLEVEEVVGKKIIIIPVQYKTISRYICLEQKFTTIQKKRFMYLYQIC